MSVVVAVPLGHFNARLLGPVEMAENFTNAGYTIDVRLVLHQDVRLIQRIH